MNKIALLLLSSAEFAVAQDALKLNQPVAHELAPGATLRYEIQLGADDYAAGSVEQNVE
jgi:hypothetical protein